ncbi:hypothetical protein, partial [Mesorhizobium sp. M7A.F.Ca.AU.001.01.1.1]|uniref:hypothetical protein n=1 Tax=Mesorhizobium sp. M7A.F.Ca.AU.001.01.1.1 TaxID=2496675 RepID=UPI0019D44A6F
PGSRHLKALRWQHQVIERMSASDGSGHAAAMCIIPQIGSRLDRNPGHFAPASSPDVEKGTSWDKASISFRQ